MASVSYTHLTEAPFLHAKLIPSALFCLLSGEDATELLIDIDGQSGARDAIPILLFVFALMNPAQLVPWVPNTLLGDRCV